MKNKIYSILFVCFSLIFVFIFNPARVSSQDIALDENAPSVSASKEPLPQIVIYSPVQNQKVSVAELQVKGEVSDDKEVVSLTVGDRVLGVSGSKIPFQHPVTLKKGRNVVYIEAKDNEGNKTEHLLTIFCESCDAEEIKFNKKIEEAVTKYAENKPVQKKQERDVIVSSLPVKGIIVNMAYFIKISTPSEVNKALSTRLVIDKNMHTIAIPGQDVNKQGAKHLLPRVVINGRPVMTRSHPVVKSGRTYVMLEKDFVEKLGAHVVRDKRNGKQYVYFYANGKMVKLAAHGQSVSSNGKLVRLDTPLKVKEGKLMLPFRALCEGLGYTVHWDGVHKTVFLKNSVVTT